MFVEEKELGEVQLPQKQTLKLSRAIRIGAMIRPQCTEAFFKDGKSCALGAAYDAVTGHYGASIEEVVAWLDSLDLSIPMQILNRVVTKNDKEGQSREAIANWLELQGY